MSDEAPFAVGQRVRVRERHRSGRWRKVPTGVVVWIEPPIRNDPFNLGWWLGVRRDGTKYSVNGLWSSRLELVPVNELTLDQTAQLLADAVKAGDTSAALPLADRVMELVGGTPGTGGVS